MENRLEKQGGGGGDLFPIMMVNALAWAVAIIVSLVALCGNRQVCGLVDVSEGMR